METHHDSQHASSSNRNCIQKVEKSMAPDELSCDALRKLKKQIHENVRQQRVLWQLDVTESLPIDFMLNLLVMKELSGAETRYTLLNTNPNDKSRNESLVSRYLSILNLHDVGKVFRNDKFFYKKDYQQSLVDLRNSVSLCEALKCYQQYKKMNIDVNQQPVGDILEALSLLNNIIFFNVTHVVIMEEDLPLYETFNSILLNKYNRKCVLLSIPTLSSITINYSNKHVLSCNPFQGDDIYFQVLDQWCKLSDHEKSAIYVYFQRLCHTFIDTDGRRPHNRHKFKSMVQDIGRRTKSIKYSNSIDTDDTYIAISFLTDQFSVMKSHWRKNVNSTSSFTGTAVSVNGMEGIRKGFEEPLGGKFIIINWSKKAICYLLNIDAPSGFFIHDHHLYIGNNRLNFISVIDLRTKSEMRKICNPAFNCIHSIQKVEDDTILVTSTGIDAIIQTDFTGKTVNDWYACEHGFTQTPKGQIRQIERNTDHSYYVYPTLHQTTHINSVVMNDNFILATLFHQGALIRIDRRNGKYKTLLTGLNCPHAIRRYTKENDLELTWTLCNTKQNEVYFLDELFSIKKKMTFDDVHWLQDTAMIQNGNIIIADANNSRMFEINPFENEIISEFSYSIDWRIYQMADMREFSAQTVDFDFYNHLYL